VDNGINRSQANFPPVTGYSQGTIDKGKPVAVGVITDFVDSKLTDFIKKVITKVNCFPYFS